MARLSYYDRDIGTIPVGSRHGRGSATSRALDSAQVVYRRRYTHSMRANRAKITHWPLGGGYLYKVQSTFEKKSFLLSLPLYLWQVLNHLRCILGPNWTGSFVIGEMFEKWFSSNLDNNLVFPFSFNHIYETNL